MENDDLKNHVKNIRLAQETAFLRFENAALKATLAGKSVMD